LTELFKVSNEEGCTEIKFFLLDEEELGGGDREVLRTIPIEDLDGGAAEEEVVSDDHSRGSELV